MSAETVRHWAVRWTSSTSGKRVPGLVRGRMRDGDGVGFGASISSDFEIREASAAYSISTTFLTLAAMAAIWASVWVRAFFAYGISRSIAQRSTLSAGHGL
jgi:hypothetical protein